MRLYGFADEASPMIDGQIAAMKRNGLSGLEIRNVDGTNVSDISIEKAIEVEKKLSDAGLITWAIGSPIGKVKIEDDFGAHMEKLKHTIAVAQALGTKNIRMFSFFLPKGCNPYDYQNEVIDRLGKMVDLAKSEEVFLCHENEKEIFGDIAERCKILHDTLPELKCVFDPANYIQCGQDIPAAWELLSDKVYYLHVKDALANGSVVPAGNGIGHLREIMAMAVKQGINDMTVEPHLTVFDGLAALENGKSVQNPFAYPTTDAAFDAACQGAWDCLK